MKQSIYLVEASVLMVLILGFAMISEAKGSDSLHLTYSTYLGGQGVEGHAYLHLDDQGNILLISHTSSGDFPVNDAIQAENKGDSDIIFAKLSPDGQELLFSTFLGGSAEDFASGGTFDSNDNLIAVGVTSSGDFPKTNALQPTRSNSTRDVFVTKLSADDQSILFSTYLGGGSDYYTTNAITDTQDNIIVAGSTDSAYFPLKDAYQEQMGGLTDGFVVKIAADGQQILWSTYFGGAWDDQIKHVTTDSEGNIIIVGVTSSNNLPITDNAYQPNKSASSWDTFVAKLSADGQILHFSTYFGGTRAWGPANVITDANDSVIIVGETNSIDFPITEGAYQFDYGGGEYDCFISKLSADGGSIHFSTYFGGNAADSPIDVEFNANHDLYIVGCTSSTDFPTTSDAFQEEKSDNTDAFVAKVDPDQGNLLFSTFIGGTGSDFASSIDFVSNSSSFLIAGHCSSTDFPITKAYQEDYGGGSFDLFISEFSLKSSDDDTTSGFSLFSTAFTFAILAIYVVLQVRLKRTAA
ncbi:MAG: SBBP repeat-containing protein [Candidatus Thorarchaeota archaeon]